MQPISLLYRTYVNISPRKEALEKARSKIRELTDKRQNFKPVEKVIKTLNKFLVPWGGYFCVGHSSQAFNKINYFVGFRLHRHLLRRSQRSKFNIGKGSWYRFFKKNGLIMLNKRMFNKV
jgi:hypothetical protein